jgi:phosphoglycerate dehydrogenase-like enzyme
MNNGGGRFSNFLTVSSQIYKKLLSYKNVLATPHIVWNTNEANYLGNEMAIDNVAARINKEPIHLMF